MHPWTADPFPPRCRTHRHLGTACNARMLLVANDLCSSRIISRVEPEVATIISNRLCLVCDICPNSIRLIGRNNYRHIGIANRLIGGVCRSVRWTILLTDRDHFCDLYSFGWAKWRVEDAAKGNACAVSHAPGAANSKRCPSSLRWNADRRRGMQTSENTKPWTARMQVQEAIYAERTWTFDSVTVACHKRRMR